MDKRSIFFIVLASVALMLFNHYFTSQYSEQMAEWERKMEAYEERQLEELKADVHRRQTALEELPVNVLNGARFATSGQPAVIAWVGFDEAPNRMNGKSLRTDVDMPNGFAFYGTEELELATLPERGVHDLQLISSDAEEGVQVHLAEWEEGQFRIPLGALDSDALAFFKTSKGYLPVGYYSHENDGFLKLSAFQSIPSRNYEDSAPKLARGNQVPEQYFVLETPYQQLVFSNYGGALAELNLPFESDENAQSVVRAIEFDRRFKEEQPHNALFPLHTYETAAADGTRQERAPQLGGYYPLLRRDIKTPEGIPLGRVSPEFYALNVVSKYPEVARLVYEVVEFTDNKIVFEAVQRHRRIRKTFTVNTSGAIPYMLDVDVQVDGDANGLWLTSGIPEVELLSGSATSELKIRYRKADSAQVDKLSLPKDLTTVTSMNPDWICNSNGFLGIILDPVSNGGGGYRTRVIPGDIAYSRLTQLDTQLAKYVPTKLPGYQTELPLNPRGGKLQLRVYAGPFDTNSLAAADAAYTDSISGEHPNYASSRSFHGWFSFISEPFAWLLFTFMRFFHWITGSWAASIVLLTVVLRIMLFPLNTWFMRSTRKMQKIGPLAQKIQEKHKKDPKKAQAELLALYKEHKVNPVSGCFPILIQMPFLIGMFDLLKSTFELRGAPFIPGWIDNLTAPDVVFRWDFWIPIIGNEFHLLPVILGAIMFVQSKINQPAVDPNEMTEQQRQQRAMGTMMTVMFTFLFYNFPSGLNIYWLSSMILGIGQQWLINKQIDNAPTVQLVDSSKKGSTRQKRARA